MAGTHVHPLASVDFAVELGQGVTIEAGAVVRGPCQIGDGTWIGPHAAVGTPAQARGGPHPTVDEPGPGPGVWIGAGCVIREFATVHQGTTQPTVVGDDAYLMAYAHVPHDAVLGHGVTLANAVQIGGHTWIGDHANIGLGATVHQWGTIGAYAMVGMQAAVTKPVPPFAKVTGVPATVLGLNAVGVQRAGLGHLEAEAAAYLAGRIPMDDLPDELRAVVLTYASALHRRSTRV